MAMLSMGRVAVKPEAMALRKRDSTMDVEGKTAWRWRQVGGVRRQGIDTSSEAAAMGAGG